MFSNIKKFVAGEGLPKHPKKHHKPFRIRHVTLFFTGVTLFVLSAFGLGYVLGKTNSEDMFIVPYAKSETKSTTQKIKSSLGFQLTYDTSLLNAEGHAANKSEPITGENLSNAYKLTSLVIRSNPNYTSGIEALSELSLQTDENQTLFNDFKANNSFTSNSQALEAYYAPEENEYFNNEKQSFGKSKIGQKTFTKIVYVKTPKFGRESKPVYQIQWLGINQGRPLKVQLDGLLGTDEIPSIYNQILSSLEFGVVTGSDFEALAFNIFGKDDSEQITPLGINAVSPAVVKVYHFICGRLVLQGKNYGNGLCGASVGSGFLISSDGVIATNGHVVSKDAADILVGEMLNNPALLAQFAVSEGVPLHRTIERDVIASMLAKLYDLPEDELFLENKEEILLAALGDEPVGIKNDASIKSLKVTVDEDLIKEARIIGVDYEPKDLLTIEQSTELGFSASDVALLKIDVEQAPFIELADSSKLQQNDNISVIGFPSDAENRLISDATISPTVTNGTISSIRTANGSASKLFQTDADASQGSSGGPAITEGGQAFGLLTYRFKDNNVANAAKSYIRDIDDIKKLIEANDLMLSTDSQAQEHWEEGLRLFNNSRYSAALSEFRLVYESYPAHRLVNTYAAQAQKAIKDGKDIKDTNYSLLGLIYGGVAGLVGIILGAALIGHHHKHHQIYKKSYTEN